MTAFDIPLLLIRDWVCNFKYSVECFQGEDFTTLDIDKKVINMSKEHTRTRLTS